LKGPEKIGDFLESALRSMGIWDEVQDAKILIDWEEIVGEKLAKVAKPVRFEDSELWIAVEDPSWRSEIFNIRDAIIKKINDKLGKELIKKLWIVK